MKKRALITGITGQSGSYLAELLLSKGYDVYGLVRRHGNSNLENSHIKDILTQVKLYQGDTTDAISIQNAIIRSTPHEIYHLAAQSFVNTSYENPIYTANANAIGTLNLLESVRNLSPFSRVYNASSSEMFGDSIDSDGFQRETTPFSPANPYACCKVFAHHIAVNYRKAYGLFLSNGIFFNHESPRRSEHFVTSKVTREAVKISLGLAKELRLGTLSTQRDWGSAKDYVRAMWMILQHHQPDDFVCATGISHPIRYLCEYVFNKLNLNYLDYVIVDNELARPQETPNLKGDSSKLRRVLGWKPEYTFESLIDEMIEHYQKMYSYSR